MRHSQRACPYAVAQVVRHTGGGPIIGVQDVIDARGGKRLVNRRVYKTLHARIWTTAMLGPTLVGAAMALADPELPHSPATDLVGYVLVLLLAAFIIRAVRLGVVIDSDHVEVRGYLITRTIRCRDIAAVSGVDYLGPWWISSQNIMNLRFDLKNGKKVRAWGVSGRVQTVNVIRRRIMRDVQQCARGQIAASDQ